jgi:AraC-like DNA-binding protein
MTAFRDMLQAFLGLITAPGEGDRLLRLDQARRYVDEHCLENISLKDAAKVGGFSPSRFSRLFRRSVGTGFGDYLLRRRLEHAKHLLLHSQLPIQQVAVEAGFSSLSYFSQAFKRALGLNPTDFRQSGRENDGRPAKTARSSR